MKDKLNAEEGYDFLYKYCRDVMWSEEEEAFIATVPELSGCHAKGKTVVEAMNNLEIDIEEWVQRAQEQEIDIPKPFCYEDIGPFYCEQVDFEKVSENEKIPHYDLVSEKWKVTTEHGKEEGDIIYVASEFVKSGLFYPYHSKLLLGEQEHSHAHEFDSVIISLLECPEFFSIKGFEKYYSKQEQELLEKIKKRLLFLRKGD